MGADARTAAMDIGAAAFLQRRSHLLGRASFITRLVAKVECLPVRHAGVDVGGKGLQLIYVLVADLADGLAVLGALRFPGLNLLRRWVMGDGRWGTLAKEGVAMVERALVMGQVVEIRGIQGAELKIKEEAAIGRLSPCDLHIRSADTDAGHPSDEVGGAG